MLAGQFNKFFVLNTTSSSQDHARGTIMGLDVIRQILTRDRPDKKTALVFVQNIVRCTRLLDIFGRSKDGAAQRSALEGSGVQMIENDFLEVGLDLLHLAQDNTAFTFNLLFPELGVL